MRHTLCKPQCLGRKRGDRSATSGDVGNNVRAEPAKKNERQEKGKRRRKEEEGDYSIGRDMIEYDRRKKRETKTERREREIE